MAPFGRLDHAEANRVDSDSRPSRVGVSFHRVRACLESVLRSLSEWGRVEAPALGNLSPPPLEWVGHDLQVMGL